MVPMLAAELIFKIASSQFLTLFLTAKGSKTFPDKFVGNFRANVVLRSCSQYESLEAEAVVEALIG